jgi:ribosomal protein S14
MKKLSIKDKKKRLNTNKCELKRFVLNTLLRNFNFSDITRWNASINLRYMPVNSSATRILNRCVLTINKKRLNKLSNFSRMVFLKLSRSGLISGIRKSSW